MFWWSGNCMYVGSNNPYKILFLSFSYIQLYRVISFSGYTIFLWKLLPWLCFPCGKQNFASPFHIQSKWILWPAWVSFFFYDNVQKNSDTSFFSAATTYCLCNANTNRTPALHAHFICMSLTSFAIFPLGQYRGISTVGCEGSFK